MLASFRKFLKFLLFDEITSTFKVSEQPSWCVCISISPSPTVSDQFFTSTSPSPTVSDQFFSLR